MTAAQNGVERPRAAALDQQIDRAQQHVEVRARFMRHAPKAVAGDLGEMKNPEVVPEQNRDFGRDDSDDHDDDQRDRRQPGEKAENDERAADRLDRTIVSTAPTNGPMRSGYGMPILAKRPAPRRSGKVSCAGNRFIGSAGMSICGTPAPTRTRSGTARAWSHGNSGTRRGAGRVRSSSDRYRIAALRQVTFGARRRHSPVARSTSNRVAEVRIEA